MLGERREGRGRSRRREAAPDLGTVAGVAGIRAQPEGGVGREREQRRQPRAQPVQDLHRGLTLFQAHVHVEAEGELLLRQPPESVHDPLVALLRGEFLLPPVRRRVRARGCDPAPLDRRRLYDAAPQSQDLRAHLRERAADGGHHLDLGDQHLGRDPVAQDLPRPPQDVLAPGAHPPGLGIHDLELFFDPQGVSICPRRHAARLLR